MTIARLRRENACMNKLVDTGALVEDFCDNMLRHFRQRALPVETLERLLAVGQAYAEARVSGKTTGFRAKKSKSFREAAFRLLHPLININPIFSVGDRVRTPDGRVDTIVKISILGPDRGDDWWEVPWYEVSGKGLPATPIVRFIAEQLVLIDRNDK